MKQVSNILTVSGTTVDVTYEAFYQKAKVSGPPEDCYPAESELNLLSVNLLEGDELPSRDRLIEACWEDFMTGGQ